MGGAPSVHVADIRWEPPRLVEVSWTCSNRETFAVPARRRCPMDVRRPFGRRRPSQRAALAVTGLALLALPAAVAGAQGADGHGAKLALNQIQVMGTHNSYHRELVGAEKATYDALVQTPGDYDRFLAYSHASLPL